MQRGMAQLPDLHVSDSSEAILSGRKPPFRLLVRAVASDGRKVNIRHAVSEGFVVRPSISSALYTRCHNSVTGMRLHCRSLPSAKQVPAVLDISLHGCQVCEQPTRWALCQHACHE